MSLALVCDIRIASTEARFISAFVHRAINPDTGSTWYLPQMLGKGRALEMMYTASRSRRRRRSATGWSTEWSIPNNSCPRR